jgi:acyl-CoA thioesterase
MQHRKGDDIMPRKITLELGEHDRFGKHIGLTFTKWEKGYSQCILKVNDVLLNPYGTVHGGALFTMTDSGMGFALVTTLEEGEQCASIEISIAYLKPATSGTLTCDTTVIQRTSKSAILESEIKKDGLLIAKALGTWIIYKKRD